MSPAVAIWNRHSTGGDIKPPLHGGLLAFFQGLGDETDLINTRASSDVDDFRHIGERQRGITLHERHPVAARLENLLEALAEFTDVDGVLIDLNPPAGIDRHNDDMGKDIRIDLASLGLG